jgi:hypothetical protein
MLHTPNLFALLRHSMARVAALITPVRAALGERKEWSSILRLRSSRLVSTAFGGLLGYEQGPTQVSIIPSAYGMVGVQLTQDRWSDHRACR